MLNQKGQSLIGVLVSMGIAGILMMLIADLNLMMVRNNTTAQANSDILGYVNTIRSNMQNQDLVTRMLQGNTTQGPVIIKDPMVAGSIMSQAGYKQQPNDAWQVSSVVFANVVSAGTGVFRLTLVLNINKDQGRTIGGSSARRVIGDVYCTVVGTTITTCSLTQPVAPPVPEPTKSKDKDDDDPEFKKGCSAIGGEMSNGNCTFHSHKEEAPCDHN